MRPPAHSIGSLAVSVAVSSRLPAAGRPPSRPRGGRGRGVAGAAAPGGPCPSFGFVGPDDGAAAAKKSRWLRRDCLRGGTGMAQRFSAWLLRHKPPPLLACAITVLAGGLATPIQPQRMYKRIQAGAAGRAHAGSAYKKDERTFFPSSFFFFFFPPKTSRGDGI